MLRAFLVCAVLAAVVLGSDRSEVVELTDATFAEHVFPSFQDDDEKDSWLLIFYAPWCGHCKHLMPVFAEAAQLTAQQPDMTIGNIVARGARFAKVDATAKDSAALARAFGVRSFPALFFVSNPTVAARRRWSLETGMVRPYVGGRTAVEFNHFARELGVMQHMRMAPAFTAPSGLLQHYNSWRGNQTFVVIELPEAAFSPGTTFGPEYKENAVIRAVSAPLLGKKPATPLVVSSALWTPVSELPPSEQLLSAADVTSLAVPEALQTFTLPELRCFRRWFEARQEAAPVRSAPPHTHGGERIYRIAVSDFVDCGGVPFRGELATELLEAVMRRGEHTDESDQGMLEAHIPMRDLALEQWAHDAACSDAPTLQLWQAQCTTNAVTRGLLGVFILPGAAAGLRSDIDAVAGQVVIRAVQIANSRLGRDGVTRKSAPVRDSEAAPAEGEDSLAKETETTVPWRLYDFAGEPRLSRTATDPKPTRTRRTRFTFAKAGGADGLVEELGVDAETAATSPPRVVLYEPNHQLTWTMNDLGDFDGLWSFGDSEPSVSLVDRAASRIADFIVAVETEQPQEYSADLAPQGRTSSATIIFRLRKVAPASLHSALDGALALSTMELALFVGTAFVVLLLLVSACFAAPPPPEPHHRPQRAQRRE